jgi:hypothetical protein
MELISKRILILFGACDSSVVPRSSGLCVVRGGLIIRQSGPPRGGSVVLITYRRLLLGAEV